VIELPPEVPKAYWNFVVGMDPTAYIKEVNSCGLEYVMGGVIQHVGWSEVYADLEFFEDQG